MPLQRVAKAGRPGPWPPRGARDFAPPAVADARCVRMRSTNPATTGCPAARRSSQTCGSRGEWRGHSSGRRVVAASVPTASALAAEYQPGYDGLPGGGGRRSQPCESRGEWRSHSSGRRVVAASVPTASAPALSALAAEYQPGYDGLPGGCCRLPAFTAVRIPRRMAQPFEWATRRSRVGTDRFGTGPVGTGSGVPTRLRRVAWRRAGVHRRADPEANGAAIRVGDAS